MKLEVNNKRLTGGLLVVGLAVIGVYYLNKNYTNKAIKESYSVYQFGLVTDANGPSVPVSAAFLNPPATRAAPRMYVQGGIGSSPNVNPGESWIQGGGASVTNTTGRWADVPGTYGGSFSPSGVFSGDSPGAGNDLSGAGYGGA